MEVIRRTHSDYLHGALDSEARIRIVDSGLAILRTWETPFEAVAVRGFSGATVGAILAHALGKALIIVRKHGEPTHATDSVEGALDWDPLARYLIIDDFVSSGATVRAIREAIGSRAEYVGTYQWQREEFYTCGPAERAWSREKEQADREAEEATWKEREKGEWASLCFKGLPLTGTWTLDEVGL